MRAADGRYRVRLAKGDFKFSAAHFTLFGEGGAERLHGHNYRVAVEVSGGSLGEGGLLVDFDRIKEAVRRACGRLDSRVLLPTESGELELRQGDGFWQVRLGERDYRFPAEDVVPLAVANTSIELLARLLWEELAPSLEGSGIDALGVEIEETEGQSCRYERPLRGA